MKIGVSLDRIFGGFRVGTKCYKEFAAVKIIRKLLMAAQLNKHILLYLKMKKYIQ